MSLSRRSLLLQMTSVTLAGLALPRLSAAGVADAPIRAIAFDAFAIFDPRPIAQTAETLFPGRGAELMNAWRARQFEYQWLRALGGRYADFWSATRDALVFAADSLKLPMTDDQRDSLMQGYLRLNAWPDVKTALQILRSRGLRLALLSNATPEILEGGIHAAGLQNLFEHVISTDRIRSFKPDPRAYQLGVDTLRLTKQEILFVAFAGWDVAGARWFGYPTYWNNRSAGVPEVLDATPESTGKTLADLTEYMSCRRG